MNETKVNLLLEALKLATHPDDYNFRTSLRRELAIELRLTPPALTKEVTENDKKRYVMPTTIPKTFF
jgi:hypothetical protein